MVLNQGHPSDQINREGDEEKPQSSAVQIRRATCHFKFGSSHCNEGKKKQVILTSNVFCLTQYIQNIITSICHQFLKTITTLFRYSFYHPGKSLESACRTLRTPGLCFQASRLSCREEETGKCEDGVAGTPRVSRRSGALRPL